MRTPLAKSAAASAGEADPIDLADPTDLGRFARWGWVPLVLGCIVIVVGVLASSEVLLAHMGRVDSDPWRRKFFLGRAVVTSTLLAVYTGFFVWLSRERIERARERLRAREEALAEQERRTERKQALGAATRILAHEIRNPLNSMSLNCAVLERAAAALPEADRERLARLSAVLRGDIERLNGLVEAYLHRGGPLLAREPVLLESLAAEVVEVHRAALDERGLMTAVEGNDGGTMVVGDPVRLRQIVHNLLRNCIEAVPRGGRVRVACARDGEYASIIVEDDGPGFDDPEAALRPFHTTKLHGTGLGLAVVRDIARMHGGSVRAENIGSGGGARVVVRLQTGVEE